METSYIWTFLSNPDADCDEYVQLAFTSVAKNICASITDWMMQITEQETAYIESGSKDRIVKLINDNAVYLTDTIPFYNGEEVEDSLEAIMIYLADKVQREEIMVACTTLTGEPVTKKYLTPEKLINVIGFMYEYMI